MIKYWLYCLTQVLFLFYIGTSSAQVGIKSAARDSLYTQTFHFNSDSAFTAALRLRKLSASYSIVVIKDSLAGIPIQKSGVLYQHKLVIPLEYDSIQYAVDHEFICRKHFVARRFYACHYLIVDAKKGIISNAGAKQIMHIGNHLYEIKTDATHYFFHSLSKQSSSYFDSFTPYHDLFLINHQDEYQLTDSSTKRFIPGTFKKVFQTDTFLHKAVFYINWDIYENSGAKLYSNLSCDSILVDSLSEKVWKLYRNGNRYYRRHISFSYASAHHSHTNTDNQFPISDTALYHRIKKKLSVDTIYFSSDGLLLYRKNKQYGYCDSAGNVKITHQYDTLTAWHEGMTAMRFKGKWGYLNKREKLCIQPYYLIALPFYKESALVHDGKRWSFINKEGKAINSLNFDSLRQTPSGRWYVYNKGKMGLCDTNGKELLPASFEKIFDSGSNMIVYKSEGLYGLILKDRTVVVKPTYSYFKFDEKNDCYLLGNNPASPFLFSIQRKEH